MLCRPARAVACSTGGAGPNPGDDGGDGARGGMALTVGGGVYRDAGAVAVSFAHLLNWSTPVIVQGGYANGGGSEHVGRGAISFVW